MGADGEPVLVVGGRGFVGAHAVRALVAAGHPVHVFDPAATAAADRLADVRDRITGVEGSIEDADALAAALGRSGARAVLSFAAFSRGTEGLLRSGEAAADRALAVNVLGFRNLLEAARAAGVPRVLWASSTVVYGPASDYGGGGDRVDEDAPRRPRSFYGLTKVLAEDVARYYRDRHGLEVCGLRLPLVFGPGLWYRGAAAGLVRLFEGAGAGAAVEVAGPEEPFDLMYVEDAAAAFLHLHGFPGSLGERYNINGFTTTWREIVATVTDLVPGYRVRFTPEAAPLTYPLVDASRIERETGYRPRRRDIRTAAADYLKKPTT